MLIRLDKLAVYRYPLRGNLEAFFAAQTGEPNGLFVQVG
jgi:hypothetical protein